MADRTPITDRGAEGRVTGYGDRVVAQGDTAAAPPPGVVGSPNATPGVPAKTPAPPTIATITIFDPKGWLKGSVRTAVLARIERDINAVRPPGKRADHLLKQLNIRFEVRHLARMSSRDERFAAGRLDFPVYILNAHSSDKTSAKEIRELMLDHGIRDSGAAAGQFKDADAGWKDANIEGLGIQPLEGYHKVGFIKGDNVSKVAKDPEAGFANVIKHELGHMCNIKAHSATGVMRSGIRLVAGHLDYSDTNAETIVRTLAQLSTLSTQVLQQRYERANP